MKKDKDINEINEKPETVVVEKAKKVKAEKPKKEKVEKVKKAKAKKNAMPEGYIGRPKPMKMTKQRKKPTAGFYVGLGFFVLLAAFIAWIVVLLVRVEKVDTTKFVYYEFDESKAPESYTLENQYMLFTLDPKTTSFTVLDKQSGKIWKSNPDGVDSDKVALVKEKNAMKSQFLLKYSTEHGVDDTFDSYNYSVTKKFYEIKKSGNAIDVNYAVGNIERTYIYPPAITETEMDVWLEEMSKSDQRTVKQAYRLINIDRLSKADNLETLLTKYPILEEDNVYEIRDSVQTYLKEKIEKIFEKAGYTEADFEKDSAFYAGGKVKNVPMFNVCITYKLDGKNLIVDVPFDKISYKIDYPVTQLSILPYFGASTTTDEGFLFVPEGSGGIINFNNGKVRQNGYYSDVYGWDYAMDRKAIIAETRSAFPVYGISYNDASFISIITDGAEYAGITADISGKMGSYNYVYPTYRMLHAEQYDVSVRTTAAQYAYEKGLPDGEHITQKYCFVNGGSYVDMAKEYRNHLFAKEKKVDNKTMPVAVEIVGAVDKVQQVMGIPKTLPYRLTSYSEATEIVKEIESLGVKNANIKLSGFINEGIRQVILKDFKLINSLGGKREFDKMINEIIPLSSKLYLDGTIMFAHRSELSDGFNRYKDPARFASSEIVELNEYSSIWYGKLEERDSYFLLSPQSYLQCADEFITNASKYGLDGVSFRDFGYQLAADYNDKRHVSRSKAIDIQNDTFKSAKANKLGVMINAGNDYALENVDFITNMTLHGNRYAILDNLVPFYQIALHGYKNYAGTAVNLGYENDQVILEAAESGAGLYFVFMKESEKILQETYYTEYYSACFDDWKDRFVSMYKEYDNKMMPVMNSTISNHEYLNNQVSCTSYDNGYKVFVNFGYVDYTTESGVLVPARDYIVMVEE
jgi:hypothetical protein